MAYLVQATPAGCAGRLRARRARESGPRYCFTVSIGDGPLLQPPDASDRCLCARQRSAESVLQIRIRSGSSASPCRFPWDLAGERTSRRYLVCVHVCARPTSKKCWNYVDFLSHWEGGRHFPCER